MRRLQNSRLKMWRRSSPRGHGRLTPGVCRCLTQICLRESRHSPPPPIPAFCLSLRTDLGWPTSGQADENTRLCRRGDPCGSTGDQSLQPSARLVTRVVPVAAGAGLVSDGKKPRGPV